MFAPPSKVEKIDSVDASTHGKLGHDVSLLARLIVSLTPPPVTLPSFHCVTELGSRLFDVLICSNLKSIRLPPPHLRNLTTLQHQPARSHLVLFTRPHDDFLHHHQKLMKDFFGAYQVRLILASTASPITKGQRGYDARLS